MLRWIAIPAIAGLLVGGGLSWRAFTSPPEVPWLEAGPSPGRAPELRSASEWRPRFWRPEGSSAQATRPSLARSLWVPAPELALAECADPPMETEAPHC